MPRPNPPRKRPRRRPDAVGAEVSLTKQTAQFKDRNGAPEPKSPNARPQSSARATKGGPPPRARRIDQPFVPWSKRSYAIFVACIAGAELVVGAAAYFTLANTPKAPRPEFGLYLLGLSYNPLVVLAAALVAAPIAKLITKETRSLRFMESVMAGIIQYFVWLALFVALTYAIGGFGATSTPKAGSPSGTATPLATTPASPAATAAPTPSPTASSTANSSSVPAVVATPVAVAGLAIIDVLSFVATFYIYPPLYRRMRIRPPPPRGPRPAKGPDPKNAPAKGAKSNVDRMDDAGAQERQTKDPTP
jgi:hypothetical protein